MAQKQQQIRIFFFLIKCEKQETRIAFGQSMFRFFSHRCLESKMKTYRKFGWNKKKKKPVEEKR